MGKKPDELQREIALQRTQLDRRAKGLRERARSGIENVRTTAKDDATRLTRTASDAVKDADPAAGVGAHPLASVAVGFAAGAVLGGISGAAVARPLRSRRRRLHLPANRRSLWRCSTR